jgi:hypothetical protein
VGRPSGSEPANHVAPGAVTGSGSSDQIERPRRRRRALLSADEIPPGWISDLDELASQIRSSYGVHIRGLRTSVQHAPRVGQLLIRVKGHVEHGELAKWPQENCPGLKSRTARAYMQLARKAGGSFDPQDPKWQPAAVPTIKSC